MVISVKRLGHATLTTPDRIRRLATELGMTTVAPDKIRIVHTAPREALADPATTRTP